MRILKIPGLRIAEYEIIESVYNWALTRCKEEPDKPTIATLQQNMRPFLPELRFLTLTAQEFVLGPTTWKVMTESETLAVLRNILKPGSEQLPEWDECHRFGHERDDRARTYVTVTREVVADGDVVLSMDEEGAEEAARDVQTEVFATASVKEVPVAVPEKVHLPELQPEEEATKSDFRKHRAAVLSSGATSECLF
ncbi:hypothetical protein HPB47_007708 [Ixodes persulcatus]|uniref:Uncharacterized protein n=1 Tax=Ixodes persulcatus TaxID=34615 RepID=A0AC60P733_IXOPE|nr:hypothetical protein HPB47_007708 [Ixodes persulcatus]